jgi:putative oxidoreductase
MQRLYSTFAHGWPGVGLLCLRIVGAIAALHFAIADFPLIPTPLLTAVEGSAGLLLCAGLWTPIAASALSVAAFWCAFSGRGDFWAEILLGAMAAALAMLGPGAWSIDARLFGRKLLILDR